MSLPIIKSPLENNKNFILLIRLIVGLIWLGTAIRRIFIPNFESRIQEMAQGSTIIPSSLMNFLVENWFLLFLIVLTIETIASLSLITGTLARGGALLATIDGFAIGMAGIGISLLDLIIPWTVAVLSLILLLFTHPGLYKGLDTRLMEKDLPKIVKICI